MTLLIRNSPVHIWKGSVLTHEINEFHQTMRQSSYRTRYANLVIKMWITTRDARPLLRLTARGKTGSILWLGSGILFRVWGIGTEGSHVELVYTGGNSKKLESILIVGKIRQEDRHVWFAYSGETTQNRKSYPTIIHQFRKNNRSQRNFLIFISLDTN